MVKRNWFQIVVLLLLMVSILRYHYLSSRFEAGDCIQALDGYIWHINDFSWGEYSAMGWQRNVSGWGNEIHIDREDLEREEYSIPIYYKTECPIFGVESL